MAKKKNEITIRSSAAEYLTFITASGLGGVEAIYADENVWLPQKMKALSAWYSCRNTVKEIAIIL